MPSAGFMHGNLAVSKGNMDTGQNASSEIGYFMGVYDNSFSLRKIHDIKDVDNFSDLIISSANDDSLDLLVKTKFSTSATFNSSIIMKNLNYATQQEINSSVTSDQSILYVDKDTQRLIFKSNTGKWDLTNNSTSSAPAASSLEEPVETLDLNQWAITNDDNSIYTFHNIGILTDDINEALTIDGAISMKEQTGKVPITASESHGKLYVGDGDLHYISGNGVDINISEKIDSGENADNLQGMELQPWSMTDGGETIMTQSNISVNTYESCGQLTVGGTIGIEPIHNQPNIDQTFGQLFSRNDGHLYYTNEKGKTHMITNEADEEKECTIAYTPNPFTLSNDTERVSLFNNSDHYLNADGVVQMKEYLSLSDETLKENITNISDNECYDVISQLQAKKYNWISSGEEAVGMIAQEVEKVVPIAVNNTNNLKGINYSSLIPYLVGAIHELQNKIETLENKY